MEILGVVVSTIGVGKMKNNLIFYRELSILCIRDRVVVTVLSNFEWEAALKDSAFWWVTCFIHALVFLISLLKRNLWWYWEWKTFEGRIWPFFMMSKNWNLFSLFAIFLNKKFFFLYGDGINNIFHNIWKISQALKIKHRNSNFETSLYYMQTNNTFIIWTREF